MSSVGTCIGPGDAEFAEKYPGKGLVALETLGVSVDSLHWDRGIRMPILK